MRKLLAVLALAVALPSVAQTEPDTTLRQHRLAPLEVLGVKQTSDGVASAEAVTRISGAEARRLGIEAVKGVSALAPNVYMPDYGSRMTSSIYVRGLGARIDQPVVGLTVDNIPYLNKDNYDFDVADIENIEIIRGAQSVLNGRNTMGGQINIRTLSPLNTRGFRGLVSYANGNTATVSAGYYGKLSEGLGMSLTGQYHHTDGFFRNSYNGERLDTENSASFRWKTAWRPASRLSLANTAVLSFNRQGGYPYASLETGDISFNDECSYRRSAFSDAVTAAWAGKRVVVTSVTSFSYLDDRMVLDQDFLPLDYFTLTQKRREWNVTEDLFTRGSRGKYSWLGGVFGFVKSTDMDAPVTFKNTGIAELIEAHRNDVNPQFPIRWDSRMFTLGSNFDLDNQGVALYHESTYTSGPWRFELGARLDVERTQLSYRSFCNTGFSTMQLMPDGSEEVYSHTPLDIDDHGSLSRTFVEFLPKVSVSYKCSAATTYISFSKGYKAGGYNTQMFSDVLQQRIMQEMGMSALYSLEEIVAYKPETSYNYELGFNSSVFNGRLELDFVGFYIDCRNQQLTVFPPGTTTGRLMTNAGRSRSLGAELTATWTPGADVLVRAAYGYTHATFRKYDNGREDFRGKRLPYAPSNTLFAELNWTASGLRFGQVTPGLTADVRCAGNIYWNEANTARQNFYALAGLALWLRAEHWSLRLWSKNLTGTSYDTFYFLSMGNEFVQHGRPRQFGATLRVNI
ncbi:MAG: TonB-dependent receptor [Muribaculaceae bacterium]|nr:TonB-dependent receptor [Muribaculaceae bacterium]